MIIRPYIYKQIENLTLKQLAPEPNLQNLI